MANTTADIGFEKQIWDAACVLRGNMDASEYKNIVLGLIFLKYISDRFEERYQQLLNEGDGFEEDIDEYLHRDFYGKKSSSGALYISEICDPDTSDNVIIYGHHMNSGSMFAALNKYKKKSFYEDHKQIVLQTLHGTEVYEVIFALTTPVYTGKDFKYYAFANAHNAREFDTYVSNCRARALYDTGGTAQYGDRLLTLSTCEYSQRNGRMLVVAKKVN